MSWQKLTLTTASNIANVAFHGRGSIFCEGTFGGGVVEVHVIHVDASNTSTVSTGFLDDAIDGSTVKTKGVPSGRYQLQLTGSTGATVDVYYNDQKQIPTK